MLVATLNWGLGHTTRCVPIIQDLLKSGFEPVLASDGIALDLLRAEFPELQTYELPSYDIRYPKHGNRMLWSMFTQLPKIIRVAKKEKKLIEKIITEGGFYGLISDNRFGVYSKKVPSVYLTHQLRVLSGLTSFLSTRIHQRIIAKYDQCWIPDFEGSQNLSGKLGQDHPRIKNIKYIGVLSRFKQEHIDKKYNITAILSGPEPQRTILEKILIKEFREFSGTALLIRGTNKPLETKEYEVEMIDLMTSSELEKTINQSELIISRSGYTSIMDMASLKKKAFFIPTPGQKEQEYLAEQMHEKRIAPFCCQKQFKLDQLSRISEYSGFKSDYKKIELSLYELFQGK